MSKPHAIVQVGNTGDAGRMEIQDLMFTAVGRTAGIVFMEWNIAQTSAGSISMWGVFLKLTFDMPQVNILIDSHFRIGGAKGTELRASDCPILSGSVKTKCIAGSLMLYLTETSTAYRKNVWAWTADHDLDLLAATRLDVHKPMYIVQTAFSWFHDALRVWHEKLQDPGIISSLSILDIVTAFPNPHKELLAEELAKTTKFFSNFNAILGILGTGVGLIPGESSAASIRSGIIGIAGGVVGAIGDSIEILSNRWQSALNLYLIKK